MNESILKVWRPPGFEWLEVEYGQNAIPDHFPIYYVTDYEFTLLSNANLNMTYRGSRYPIEGADTAHGTLMIQHPHSTVGAERTGKKGNTWCMSLKIREAQFLEVARECASGEASLPYFKTPTPENAQADAKLSALAFNAFRAASQAVSRLEREEELLRLIRGSIALFGKPLGSSAHTPLEHRAVSLVRDHLRENALEDVTLDYLAALCNLNKYYLLQIFKQTVGVSPHVYQTSIRIQRAKELLAQGSAIARVAHDVGFVDQSHLNRQFNKYVRVTPGQFQRDSLGG